MTTLVWALPALFMALASFAAYRDARFRTIPNWLNLLIAVLGVAATWWLAGAEGILPSLAHFALALAIGLLVYALKMWGGGDAKFYAATAAWFSLGEFPRLIMAVSLAGLVLLAGWIVIRRGWKPKDVGGGRAQLPYGVAIAAGGIITMAARTLEAGA